MKKKYLITYVVTKSYAEYAIIEAESEEAARDMVDNEEIDSYPNKEDWEANYHERDLAYDEPIREATEEEIKRYSEPRK